MKEERLMEALGSIRDTYVLEAAITAGKTKKRRHHWVAALLAILLGAALFTQTAAGGAAAAVVKEQVSSWIESLFPPKELTAAPEGAPENATYSAGGQLPQQDSTAARPGFALYYDPERYVMTEENGAAYLRSIPVVPTREEIWANNADLLAGLSEEDAEEMVSQLLEQQTAFYAALPICELEILHVPDTTPEAAAAAPGWKCSRAGPWSASRSSTAHWRVPTSMSAAERPGMTPSSTCILSEIHRAAHISSPCAALWRPPRATVPDCTRSSIRSRSFPQDKAGTLPLAVSADFLYNTPRRG